MSFYEKILDLPLFKGLSVDTINLFVEKTPLAFSRYNPGEIIVSEGDLCNSIKCILDGKFKISHSFFESDFIVSHSLDSGYVIGSEYLLGLDNHYPFQIVALSECSVMEFSKTHYLNRIKESHLMLINFLNQLSLSAQKNLKLLSLYSLNSPSERIKFIIECVTHKKSFEITLSSFDNPLHKYLGNKEDLTDFFRHLEEDGIIDFISDKSIVIRNRERMLDKN